MAMKDHLVSSDLKGGLKQYRQRKDNQLWSPKYTLDINNHLHNFFEFADVSMQYPGTG